MGEQITYCLIYFIWGLFDLANIWLIYDRFFVVKRRKTSKYKWWSLILFWLIDISFGFVRYHGYSWGYILLYLPFYLKTVPVIYTFFQKKVDMAIAIFFYEEIVSLIGQNIDILMGKQLSTISMMMDNRTLIRNTSDVIAAGLFLVLLGVLLFCQKSRWIHIYFADRSIREYAFLVATVFTTGSLEYNILNENNLNIQTKVFSVLLTGLVCVLISIMVVIQKRNISMSSVVELLEKQMKKTTSYYNELNEKNIQIRRFRHDVKNHLIVLHSMVKDGKSNQALEYIEKMEGLCQMQGSVYDTGNFIADALLSFKANIGKKNNTTICVNGFIPAERVEDVDLVIILSNILDNALEACTLIEGHKEIRIQSVLRMHMWVLEVKNPVGRNVEIRNNHIATSKEDKELHGLGLQNVERVVEHYDGNWKMECRGGEFTVRITLILK